MSSKDIINLFNNYSNRWSQRENGGASEISLVLPGFEEYALKTRFPIRTTYDDIHEDLKIVPVATNTIENPYDVPQQEYINLAADVEEWGRWKFTDVATSVGNHVVKVDMPHDMVIPALGDRRKVPIHLLNEEAQHSGLRTWSVKHPFELNPRTRVIATLQVKQKEIKRDFSVENNLSGYLGVITEHLVNNHHMSLHHIKRVLQCYHHPLIRITDSGVTLTSNGDFSALFSIEQMIHIKIESLDCPEITEEYTIYNPETGKKLIRIKDINPTGPQKTLLTMVESEPKPQSGQSFRSSNNFNLDLAKVPYAYALQFEVSNQPANMHFSVAEDIRNGNDKVIFTGIGNGVIKPIEAGMKTNNLYIGGPQNATSVFKVYIYALHD
ncbi:hypothetical protein ACQVTS_29235 [Bacillus mycoides]|uniref:hypothetical protein n=1 Tax=Bacillus mycoides TaxID=1405 RepID=UPI003D649DDE